MRMTLAGIIIALGFVTLYLTITGKIDIFAAAFRQAFLSGSSGAAKPGGVVRSAQPPNKTPSGLPRVFNLPKFNIPGRPTF